MMLKRLFQHQPREIWIPILLSVVPWFHYSPGAGTDGPSKGPSGNRFVYTQGVAMFPGFYFYRCFIWGFHALSYGNVSVSRSPAAERALIASKQRFTQAPILQQQNPETQVTVEVDASNTGVGQVLSQRSLAEGTVTATPSVDCP